MKLSALIILIYGILILVGGMIGFSQAHSLPSLIAGSISGILLIACAYGMFKRSVFAYTLAMAMAFVLTTFFTYRFVLTGKFMPAGMMMIVSLATLVFTFAKRKSKARG